MITALFRTIILYFFIVFGMRLLGKRQIGELELGELVLALMLSDLAAVPMQDFGMPLLTGLIPISTLLVLSFLLSQLSFHSLWFRKLICGSPSILIHNGTIQQETLRKNRLTVDELLEELRIQGISQVEDVKYALLETSGQVSVLPFTAQMPPTSTQLKMNLSDSVNLPVILINNGRVLDENLTACGRDRSWLSRQLHKQGLASHEVFLLTLNEQGDVFCVKKEEAP